MKTLTERIEILGNNVNAAQTYEADGRQIIANSCKELNEILETPFYEAGAECLLADMYTDLCQGDFSEPFLCEQIKSKFALYAKIYNENIA